MGVFVCADDTSGICRGLLSFTEKCVFTKKSEMFLVHTSFTKSTTGLAHDWKPWQSLPDLCLWGPCTNEILQRRQGTVELKNKKLGEKKRLAVIHAKINCQKNDVSPEHEALLFFYRKTPVICSWDISLEIFVTNYPPDKIQDPDMQNKTKKMYMVGWWFPAINPGATWKC